MRTGQQPLEINPENWTLTSSRTSRGGTQEYFVYSLNPANTTPDQAASDLPALSFRFTPRYAFVPSGMDTLGALSASVASPDTLQRFRGSSERKVAMALVEYLRDSGRFGYTLKVQVHDPNVDPIEDFLMNRREGHCEYFASALALLLRTRGIPSRVITGFKGGRLNELTNAWEVQQRHAHSWVEAYLDEHWVTLDAVPSGRLQSLAQFDRTPDSWQNVKSLSSAVWDKYVMRLDGNVPQEWFYDPLQRQLGGVEFLRARQSLTLRQSILNFFTSPQEWLSWRGVFAAAFLVIAGFSLYRLLRRLPAWLKRLMQWAGVATAQRRVQIDFYERFRELAESRGLRRRPGQTQREFVTETQQLWMRAAVASGFQGIADQLPNAFYLERFGEERIQPADREALNSALDQLERWLKEHPRPRFGNGLAEGGIAP
jgi:transglutaminase-like putative cysteine protease